VAENPRGGHDVVAEDAGGEACGGAEDGGGAHEGGRGWEECGGAEDLIDLIAVGQT